LRPLIDLTINMSMTLFSRCNFSTDKIRQQSTVEAIQKQTHIWWLYFMQSDDTKDHVIVIPRINWLFSASNRKDCLVKRNCVKILAPITSCEKVLCIGMNYTDHCKEQNADIPTEPVVFNKFPSCIVGPDDSLSYPEEAKVLHIFLLHEVHNWIADCVNAQFRL
jgi:2-keto-4-pentenoate hydratase/2-oxohepta-3-ene-1,7-dioic acid hydratase in catechol pathway